ncbi:AAA family ATPase [Vibrio parahaemolyticus]|uniref:AAA family ATPase n=1 Tax=Vibrio parahaemolyticus TaxID=670 RepID=UPI0009F15A52|nr:AAA family ATPase [Vibrio parahaemolyticus]EIQ1512689.1 ATP-binding protein [Vibrio parahaemolyticus]EJG1693275.1 ATP-binding protein [Vibrio parahaemolyticus]EJT1886184.1 ATP-binding protein [Vibrio parahaemolyticus]ELB2130737.1 ATP-binding protein [Vibrio parahaemolyticus]ELB2145696.1 ATP-binding protein [Vibrio parahaemolyticus]
MIAGLFLRYIKTYSGYNYIPLTDSDPFCGIVGENGIGKSSVLEALDCFFNDRTWNYHTSVSKKGTSTRPPQIVPVFLVEKSELEGSPLQDLASTLDHVAKSIQAEGASSNQKLIREFVKHREQISRNLDLRDYYVLPIGFDHRGDVSLSIFGSKLTSNDNSDEEGSPFTALLHFLKDKYEYIYIPREIDAEMFTKLETAEIQGLMGETLHQILKQRVPESKVREINKELTEFIDTLSVELQGQYCYKTPGKRQLNLRKTDLYNLIIQAFFSNKKLHKKTKSSQDEWLEIKQLSSGEKQKAIIDVAYGFLNNHRESAENLIIAIDEPESSLHMSSCYDQFDALFQISRSCRQLIFTTHWYGFLPIIESGAASVISKVDNTHAVDLINLGTYREQIKQWRSSSRGVLPYDIRLKSTNDLVQSVITSTISENPYNWLICEGTSEKIYLSHFLKDLVNSKKLRIVPVGGASEIKRLYRHLSTCYEDFKDEIKGTIYLLSDTDSELVDYEVKNFDKLHCKRLVQKSGEGIKLVNINSNPKSPETEIEDALDGIAYWDTLMTFVDTNMSLRTLSDIEPAEGCCAFESLDLKRTEIQTVKEFFDSENNKYEFARKYVELHESASYSEPNWIDDIRKTFTIK